MGFYTDKSDKTFFPVVYVREDGVLERQLELLPAGWVGRLIGVLL